MVCDIASGFWDEIAALNPEAELPSGSVIRQMSQKRKTKHENQTSKILKQSGLSCPLPIDWVDIGDGKIHEVFRVESFIRVMSLHDKLPLLLGHVKDFSLVDAYWKRLRVVDPEHPVFNVHGGREKYVVPCYLHCDEGRTLKKSSIMVCNLQPVLGGNPTPTYDPEEMHTNMKYSSYCTRLLLFVMVKQLYKKDSTPFYKILESIAQELLHLWEHGVEIVFGKRKITLHVCVMSLKGDWPVLAKVGNLERSFSRKTRANGVDASGVCHLCLAGRPEIPYHDFADTATWRSTYLLHDPFKPAGSPLAALPGHGAMFYRFDVFHCCHKGIMAELAGSGLVGLGELSDFIIISNPKP